MKFHKKCSIQHQLYSVLFSSDVVCLLRFGTFSLFVVFFCCFIVTVMLEVSALVMCIRFCIVMMTSFCALLQDVLVVGEPSLMGGEFGDEDERKITRLENSSNNNTGTTPTGGSTSSNTNTSANPNPGTLTNSSSFNNNNNTPSGGGVNSNPKNSNNNPSANNNIFTNANNILPPQPNNCTPPSPLGSIAPANASLNQSQPPNPNTPATLNGPRSSKVMNGPTSPGAVGASQLPSLSQLRQFLKKKRFLIESSLTPRGRAHSSITPKPNRTNTFLEIPFLDGIPCRCLPLLACSSTDLDIDL